MPDNSTSQIAIDTLIRENASLRDENKRLKAQNQADSVHMVGMRQCPKCQRNLPDGPNYFPGFLETMSGVPMTELLRYQCVYCRSQD